MQKGLIDIAKKVWPNLESVPEPDRTSGAFNVIGFLYSVPLAVGGSVWLITATDWAVIRTEWAMLLLFFFFEFLFERFDFFLTFEITPGPSLTWQSSLGPVVVWSLVLVLGPTGLWLFVFWWLIWFVRQWRQSMVTSGRWHIARNLTFNLACTTFGPMVALTVYRFWVGGVWGDLFPLPDLSVGTILPALGATFVWWLLSTLIWLPLFVTSARVRALTGQALKTYVKFWAVTTGSHFLADPFAILGAGLYIRTGPGGYLFFTLALLLASFLAHQLSQATVRVQQRSRDLEKVNVQLLKEIADREHSERLQSALYRIAAVANSEISLDELFRSIHEIISELMDVENFYIALYDPQENLLQFPYFVDKVDASPADPHRAGRGLTEYVIRTDQPLLITQEERDELIRQGELELVGAPAPIWLGVPLKAKAGRFGAMVVQHYTDEKAYGEREKQVLTFVSGQVATAIERKQAEETLQKYTKDLAAAVDRLEELDRLKNEFIQNVSHELRSPLALIRGYAEILSTGELGVLEPDQQKPVEIITRRAQMLGNLVEDITLILKAETRPLEKEWIAIDELARAAVEDFEVLADQAGLTLQAEILPDLPQVSGQLIYLRRVLDNLLSNALKFTPAGGTITLRVYHQDEQIWVQVADTGIGIPPEQQERVFDRFYQIDGSTQRRYRGMGLGLALVKELVALHGGQVAVESTLGEGTTFTISLPTG